MCHLNAPLQIHRRCDVKKRNNFNDHLWTCRRKRNRFDLFSSNSQRKSRFWLSTLNRSFFSISSFAPSKWEIVDFFSVILFCRYCYVHLSCVTKWCGTTATWSIRFEGDLFAPNPFRFIYTCFGAGRPIGVNIYLSACENNFIFLHSLHILHRV